VGVWEGVGLGVLVGVTVGVRVAVGVAVCVGVNVAVPITSKAGSAPLPADNALTTTARPIAPTSNPEFESR